MAYSKSVETIMEEREELMVSPTGGKPTLRTAHFLNPTLTSILDFPSLSLSSNPTISELKKTPLKVQFKGLRCPQKRWQKRWKTWVERLQPAYQLLWKKAGIYDTILGSMYHTPRHNDLVIGLAERWCFETNTFIFPWGEATITLEDMVVLGGYSVLGCPVFNPLQTKDLIEIEEYLSKVHRDIRLGSAQASSYYAWMDHFMESGDPFEHQAFLVLWLSRYVFPHHYETVRRNVFPIAIHLSRGTPIALAPAILATIYRDLSLLKKSVIALTKLGTNSECEGERGDDALTVTLCAPFQLVQLWAWERFATLRNKPNPIRRGEPRSARWHRLKRLKVENVGMALDSARECFLWRPYAAAVNNWMFSKFYRESEEWVLVKSDMDKELESFARCLRACELVSLDCIEQYLPHRIAMQFGMDQDVPGHVTRSNETPEIAWRNYIRPIKDAKLYIPYRLFKSDVTNRYSEWWKQSMLACQNAIKGVVSQQCSETYLNDNYDFVQSGVPSKRIRVENVDEDTFTIAEKLSRCYDKHISFADRTIGDHQPQPDNRFQSFSSSAVVNEAGRNMESPMKPIEMSMQDKTLMGGPKSDIEAADASGSLSMRVNNNEEESFSHESFEIPRLELEDRVSKLEKLVGGLKAAKFGCRLEKNLLPMV